MRAIDATLACLKRAGVNAIFGIPGGPVIPLFDALHDDPDIRTYLVRHEQGAGHMAEGYAKATGRVGVCTATSGPGATNLVTPIADAYMDSVPLLALTGQVGAARVGTDAFQEADIVGITLPIVKHSYLIKEASELPDALTEALHLAQSGRPGPVLVDVCVDQWAREVGDLPEGVPPMPGYQPPTGAGHPRQLAAAARALAGAQRPVIYAASRRPPASRSPPP
jgi:acetolactate synthase-1/2/3 large subunit